MANKVGKKVTKKRKPEQAAHLVAHQFKKGQSGNPEGARAHNPFNRAVKQMTSQLFSETIQLVLSTPVDELDKFATDNTLTVMQRIIIKALLRADENESFGALDTIMERVIGKVAEKMEIESPKGTMSPTSIDPKKLTLEDLKKLKEIQIKSDGH
jgi:hypothetical protein